MKRDEALKSVVRFRDDGLVTVGGGVFLGRSQILSLSTVVRNSLGWRDAEASRSDEPVPVDFPFCADSRLRYARVLEDRHVSIDTDLTIDLTLLELSGAVPADAHVAEWSDEWVPAESSLFTAFSAEYPGGIELEGRMDAQSQCAVAQPEGRSAPVFDRLGLGVPAWTNGQAAFIGLVVEWAEMTKFRLFTPPLLEACFPTVTFVRAAKANEQSGQARRESEPARIGEISLRRAEMLHGAALGDFESLRSALVVFERQIGSGGLWLSAAEGISINIALPTDDNDRLDLRASINGTAVSLDDGRSVVEWSSRDSFAMAAVRLRRFIVSSQLGLGSQPNWSEFLAELGARLRTLDGAERR
jgi:hypothetical protein